MKNFAIIMAVLLITSLSTAQTQTVNMLSDTGNVGVGTTSPSTKLEVVGDTKLDGRLEIINEVSVKDSLNVSKKLTVEQDVLIKGKSVFSDEGKFKSELRVLGTARMKEKLVVDSVARFNDKIVVDGLGKFNGDIKLTGDFIFGNNKRISYLYPTGANPEIIVFGGQPMPPSLNPCLFPAVPLYQFQGVLQSYGTNSGFNNVMTVGFDGANGIIEMEGTSTGVEPRLLINYNCGKDIFMNTGVNGGNVIMTTSTIGNVGIGTDNPTAKLEIVGSFRLNNGSQGENKVLVSDANGIASWQLPNTLDGGGWTINGSNIYRASGNVGIGTNSPNYTLDVEGDISVRSNAIVLIDENHGLSHGNSLLNDLQVDGPFLYGWGGGSLGINHSGNYTKVLNWTEYGKVGIGVDIPSEALDVNGNIKVRNNGNLNEKSIAVVNNSGTDVFRVMGNGNVYATKILVRNTPFPDYVFNPDYNLMTLMELENYIITNKHLPNMPTSEKVEKEGADIGEINRLLVEKTEELTLYIIGLKKELDNLKKEINSSKK